MNDLTLAWSILTTPGKAFTELRERPRFAFPLIVLIAAGAILLVWYYNVVDIEWLKQRLFADNPRIQRLTDAQRERMLSLLTVRSMTISGVASAAIGLPLVMAVEAGYYWLAGKVSNLNLTFLQLFSLLAWTLLPTLAGVLGGAIVLLINTNHGQIDPSDLQVLSLNSLFFQLAPNEKGYQLLSGLNLLNLWTWGLLATGIRAWTGKTWAYAVTFVLVPFVVFYAGVAYISL